MPKPATLPEFPPLTDADRQAAFRDVQGHTVHDNAVNASAVGSSGRRRTREYDLLLTNRLVLQPLVEFEVCGRSDRERGIDAGLSTGELGLRVRYEVRREFAPYISPWGVRLWI
ncbi:MAG: copper resistance protein B [Acidobacteria bacterium]|nr:copper resistance protein B [Acidobacteriota bacterium]